MYKSAEALAERLASLPVKHRAVLKEYYDEDSLNGSSRITCENKILELMQFEKFVNKPFKDVTKSDIKAY